MNAHSLDNFPIRVGAPTACCDYEFSRYFQGDWCSRLSIDVMLGGQERVPHPDARIPRLGHLTPK